MKNGDGGWNTSRYAPASVSASERIRPSAPVSPEQHGDDPAVLSELAELNRAYEERYGFRFVVFVNGRSRAEILPELRDRLENTREQELDTGLDALVSIAEDRWRRS